MPGTVHVDSNATFQTILLMSIAEKMQFGTDVPEVSKQGEAKYSASLAVTYRPDGNMPAQSEVITATLTGGDRNVILSLQPGSLVELSGLRCGVSSPEAKANGRISGGKFWWQVGTIKPARQLASVGAKSEG